MRNRLLAGACSLACLGALAGQAAAQSASIDLTGAQFRNATNVNRSSAPQTLAPAARYHTVVSGNVHGTPFLSLLWILAPSPTPLATVMEQISPGSSAALNSYGINPTTPPTHPFLASNLIASGTTTIGTTLVTYGYTIQAGIDAANYAYFSLTNVTLTPSSVGYLVFDNGTAVITRIPCPVDVDGNTLVEPSDIAAFVNIWFTSLSAGTLAGDYSLDGIVSPADVAQFVAEWFVTLTSGGCPP